MIFGTVQRCATSTASVVSGARIGNALSFANEGTGTRVAIKAHAPATQARNMHYLKCFDCSQSRNVSKQSSPFMLVASPSNKFTSQRVFTSRVFAKNSNLPNKVASSQRNKSSMVQAVPVLTRFLESNVLLNAGAVLSLGGL